MALDSVALAAIWLTFKLASVTTLVLLLIGTPIAWWLARTTSRMKGPIGAVVALPLVLLGFHATLVAFGVAGEMLYWSDLIMTLGAIGAGALYGAVNISLTSRQQKAAASPQQQ